MSQEAGFYWGFCGSRFLRVGLGPTQKAGRDNAAF